MIAKLFIFWCVCEVIVFASSASPMDSRHPICGMQAPPYFSPFMDYVCNSGTRPCLHQQFDQTDYYDTSIHRPRLPPNVVASMLG